MIPNPDKFKAIILKKDRSDTSNMNLKIDNQEIKTASSVELIGIKLDNKLSQDIGVTVFKRLFSFMKELILSLPIMLYRISVAVLSLMIIINIAKS